MQGNDSPRKDQTTINTPLTFGGGVIGTSEIPVRFGPEVSTRSQLIRSNRKFDSGSRQYNAVDWQHPQQG